jgi:IMP dehydrogenase
VDIGWKLGGHLLELPLLASAMDGVVSPQIATALGRMGGLGVLNLEGIFTRYADAEKQLEKIASFSPAEATSGMQEIYCPARRAEADRAPDRRDQGGRCARGRVAHAAARS